MTTRKRLVLLTAALLPLVAGCGLCPKQPATRPLPPSAEIMKPRPAHFLDEMSKLLSTSPDAPTRPPRH